MIPLFKIILIFLASLIIGAAISYPAFLLVSSFITVEFESVASKCVLLSAIIILLVFYRSLGITSWQEIGYNNIYAPFWRSLLKGFFYGSIIMLCVIAILLLTENRIQDSNKVWTIQSIFTLFVSALFSAFLIAVIEETLFRGAILHAFKKCTSVLFSIFATSLIYGLLHFINPEFLTPSETLGFTSGFKLISESFYEFTMPLQIIDSFLALFLAGVLLALVRIKSGSLASCIGIHAAWVLCIKVLKKITDSNYASEFSYLTGSYDKVIGYAAAGIILLFIIFYYRLVYTKES